MLMYEVFMEHHLLASAACDVPPGTEHGSSSTRTCAGAGAVPEHLNANLSGKRKKSKDVDFDRGCEVLAGAIRFMGQPKPSAMQQELEFRKVQETKLNSRHQLDAMEDATFKSLDELMIKISSYGAPVDVPSFLYTRKATLESRLEAFNKERADLHRPFVPVASICSAPQTPVALTFASPSTISEPSSLSSSNLATLRRQASLASQTSHASHQHDEAENEEDDDAAAHDDDSGGEEDENEDDENDEDKDNDKDMRGMMTAFDERYDDDDLTQQ